MTAHRPLSARRGSAALFKGAAGAALGARSGLTASHKGHVPWSAQDRALAG